MKKIIISIILMFGLAFVQAGEPIGKVAELNGDAFVKHADGSLTQLTLGYHISQGDEVSTTKGSKLKIQFIDDSLLSQGELSQIVIDRYVFDPDVKESNEAHLSLIKGFFRIITEKITKLNPEKYTVNTANATIGIRGCDLGFMSTASQDLIWVAELHHADSVLVKQRTAAENQEVVIREGGVGVSASANEFKTFKFNKADFLKMIENTSPDIASVSQAWGEWGSSAGPEELARHTKDMTELLDKSRDEANLAQFSALEKKTSTSSKRPKENIGNTPRPNTATVISSAGPSTAAQVATVTPVTPVIPVVPTPPDPVSLLPPLPVKEGYIFYYDGNGKIKKKKIKKPKNDDDDD